jgi:hypothetical protein
MAPDGRNLRCQIASRNADSQYVAVAKQFTLGEETGSPDATKLPFKLGPALLRDPDGKIVLYVPVGGSPDDPKFRLGRVVLRTVVNVFKKIVTPLFKLLGKLFSRNEVDLSTIEFPAGSAERWRRSCPRPQFRSFRRWRKSSSRALRFPRAT